jgi:hypothetical protein
MSQRKIYRHRATLSDGKGIIKSDTSYKVDTFNVIGENEKCLCIDDEYFTTIRKGDVEFFESMDRSSIGIHCDDRVWGNRVNYTRYSETPISAEYVRAEISAAIKKKIGFFMKKIDLSFIKDEVLK